MEERKKGGILRCFGNNIWGFRYLPAFVYYLKLVGEREICCKVALHIQDSEISLFSVGLISHSLQKPFDFIYIY